MKELSTEQKAKAYDLAIDAAKKYHNGTLKDVMETIFPELKESEDEKIKNDIRDWLINYKDNVQVDLDDEEVDRWVSWLEKQGESELPKDLGEYIAELSKQFPEVSFAKLSRIAVRFKNWLEKQREQKATNNQFTQEQADVLDKHIDKFLEQKHAGEVKPKFKVGDWLCENEPNNYARYIQILEIVKVLGKERYRISRNIHDDKDLVEFYFVEKYYHKFDIKDAKDGDVLVTKNKNIFIFKSISNYTIYDYCGLYFGKLGFSGTVNGRAAVQLPIDYIPATKEQRDTLERAMANAGWEFDFDKKELKQIVTPIFNIGDVLCDKSCATLSKAQQPNIEIIGIKKGWYICDKYSFPISQQDNYELVAKKIEQKPAELSRSEVTKISDQVQKSAECRQESKPNGGIVYEDFNEGDGSYKVNLAYLSKPQVAFIEDLVASWQNPTNNTAEWSEGDENMIKRIKEYLNIAIGDLSNKLNCKIVTIGNSEYSSMMIEISKCISWLDVRLKSLKDRMQPQPEQEWSEEDEKIFQSIIDDTVQENQLGAEQIDWIRNIKYRNFSRPQKQWKPTEEQMEALDIAQEELCSTEYNKPICDLIDSLNKLREE